MIWTEEAFQSVFRAVYPRLVRAAQLMLGDREAAEDVAQETFARLLARDQLVAPDAERWVFRVGRNLAIGRIRQVKRLLPLTRAAEDELATWDVVPDDERRVEQLRGAVSALPVRQREVVALRIYAELSYEEIARTVGRSLGSVKQDLHRAKLALKARLNGTNTESIDAW